MTTYSSSNANREARLRAQSAAFRNFKLASPPGDPDRLDWWLQQTAGFILMEKVRAAGLATLAPDSSEEVRAAVTLAVDATMYALMMNIEGVTGGLQRDGAEVLLTFGVELMQNNIKTAEVDLSHCCICMAFHGWCEGDFGDEPVVEE